MGLWEVAPLVTTGVEKGVRSGENPPKDVPSLLIMHGGWETKDNLCTVGCSNGFHVQATGSAVRNVQIPATGKTP